MAKYARKVEETVQMVMVAERVNNLRNDSESEVADYASVGWLVLVTARG
jgi:hypothetical protein